MWWSSAGINLWIFLEADEMILGYTNKAIAWQLLVSTFLITDPPFCEFLSLFRLENKR